MGLFDNFRRGGKRLGLELGRRVAAVEARGDRPTITAAGQSVHAGYSGPELGRWLERWLETADIDARNARAVLTEGNVYHYLVEMPEMSASERHLAAGAEVRKLAPVPAAQLAYGHVAVGETSSGRQKVLVTAVDKSTVRNATEAVEAAGLSVELITTVPAALVRTAELMPSRAGGMAIAWLSEGRSYLTVFHDGRLELVRDFALRDVEVEADPEAAAAEIGAELRRSFLYFGQRGQGASVDRVILAGPLSNLEDIRHRLQDSLGIRTELFDLAGQVDLGGEIATDDQPAFAAALGAAALDAGAGANLVPPEEVNETRMKRATSIGGLVAGVLLLLLLGWGVLALLDSSVKASRLAEIEERLGTARTELQEAEATQEARAAHRARRAMLENRALESTLIGAALQRFSMRLPDEVTLTVIEWQRVIGPAGEPYWNARLDGLVLGGSRSDSQAVFNRFWTLLVNDPLVADMHLVEPLVIGNEGARVPPPLTAAVREDLRNGVRVIEPQQAAPAGSENFDNPQSGFQPGSVVVRTTIDDLPPFGASETSVAFKVAVQLKGIDSGDER